MISNGNRPENFVYFKSTDGLPGDAAVWCEVQSSSRDRVNTITSLSTFNFRRLAFHRKLCFCVAANRRRLYCMSSLRFSAMRSRLILTAIGNICAPPYQLRSAVESSRKVRLQVSFPCRCRSMLHVSVDGFIFAPVAAAAAAAAVVRIVCLLAARGSRSRGSLLVIVGQPSCRVCVPVQVVRLTSTC
jgi:hypothetical protein